MFIDFFTVGIFASELNNSVVLGSHIDCDLVAIKSRFVVEKVVIFSFKVLYN